MAYECKVLADSIANGVRLTTLVVTFPRIVLAEFNTHRVFSRNSASSRAIPVEKNIARVLDDPFIPEAFCKNQKGMQAGVSLDEEDQTMARGNWTAAMRESVGVAQRLARLGVHKQWANRLLEPFAWHTVIVTATDWENFFALRCNENASPEIRRAAEIMRSAMAESDRIGRQDLDDPRLVEEAWTDEKWHLPLIPDLDELSNAWNEGKFPTEESMWKMIAKISSARCARVSYLTHDGRRSPDEDLALAERLLEAGHMSPFEHAAKVERRCGEPICDGCDYEGGCEKARSRDFGNFRFPWLQYRKMIPGESVFQR